jgi:excisionase family DNA binding protein
MSFIVPPLPGERLYTRTEAAEALRCSEGTIRKLLGEGRVSAVRIANRLYIPSSEVDRLGRDWPAAKPKGRGAAARWAEFRAWKAQSNAIGEGE